MRTTKGSSVLYRCLPGFDLVPGRRDRVLCLESGAWASERPECRKINCDHPPLIDNAMVEVEVRIAYCVRRNTNTSLTPFPQSTLFNASAAYICDPGYQLQGPQSLLCSEFRSGLNYFSPSVRILLLTTARVGKDVGFRRCQPRLCYAGLSKSHVPSARRD